MCSKGVDEHNIVKVVKFIRKSFLRRHICFRINFRRYNPLSVQWKFIKSAIVNEVGFETLVTAASPFSAPIFEALPGSFKTFVANFHQLLQAKLLWFPGDDLILLLYLYHSRSSLFSESSTICSEKFMLLLFRMFHFGKSKQI